MNHGDRCHIEIERRIPIVVWPIAASFGFMLLWFTLLYFGTDVGSIYQSVRSTGLQIPGRFIPWKRMISYRVSDSDTLSLKFKRPLAGPAMSLHMQLPKDIATQVHHAFVAHGVQFRGGSSHSSN